MATGQTARQPVGRTEPMPRSLDGIERRRSLKAEYDRLLQHSCPEPPVVANAHMERPKRQERAGRLPPDGEDALRRKMIDTLLTAYVGIRGHLHAPGMVRLGDLSEQIAETLAETGTLENWLPWHGGECPLPPSVEVEIAWSDGGRQIAKADAIPWAVPEKAGIVDLAEALRFVMFYRVVRW